jgi:hypothetical protein
VHRSSESEVGKGVIIGIDDAITLRELDSNLTQTYSMSKRPKFRICNSFPLESNWNSTAWPVTEVPSEVSHSGSDFQVDTQLFT